MAFGKHARPRTTLQRISPAPQTSHPAVHHRVALYPTPARVQQNLVNLHEHVATK